MKVLKVIGQFLYDFIIGDDWKIAAGVVIALLVTWLVLATGAFSDAVVCVFGGVVIIAMFVVSLFIDVRNT